MLKQKIKSLLNNSTGEKIYILSSMIKSEMLSIIPDKLYLEWRFKSVFGKRLNLDNPVSFSEKLQWLKLYDRKPEYTMMVDKHLVKKYVADLIGDEYIIPTIGVWNRPEQIDLNQLPDKFVIKCNHNSGVGMLICKDKTAINEKKMIIDLHIGLKNNYFLRGREWPYKDVKRVILAEEYIDNPEGGPLKDYKVLCFNGEPKLIELHQGRFTDDYTQDFYDTNWNKTPIVQVGDPPAEDVEPRPEQLEKMLELSRILARGIPHVRIDWYYVEGKLYFGEITFFDGSGFVPFVDYKYDLELGSWIDLPEKTC